MEIINRLFGRKKVFHLDRHHLVSDESGLHVYETDAKRKIITFSGK